MDVADVRRHLGLAPEEAPALAGRVARRVFVIGQGARAAPVDPALLTVLHREVHLDRYPGVERVPAQGATVQVMRVAVEQVPLKEVGMRVELLAGAAGVLFADLAQVVLDQMVQHALAVGEGRLALGTRVSRHLVAVVGLQVPRQVFPEGLEVFESGAATTAQEGTSGVTAVCGGSVRGEFVREIRRFRHVSGPLQPRVSRIVDAVHLRLPVLHHGRTRRGGPAILAVLKNVVLGVGGRGRARDAAQRAHHHRGAERAEPVYRQQVFAQAAQRGELHGALVARERVLVVVPLAGPLTVLGVFPVARVLRRQRAVLPIQRFVAGRSHLLVRPAGRRRHSQTFAAQNRLVHRVHVHLQLLHAAE